MGDIKVLMVGEKPLIASTIASILSNNNVKHPNLIFEYLFIFGFRSSVPQDPANHQVAKSTNLSLIFKVTEPFSKLPQ